MQSKVCCCCVFVCAPVCTLFMQQCEDLEQTSCLQHLFRIMRSMVMLNDTQVCICDQLSWVHRSPSSMRHGLLFCPCLHTQCREQQQQTEGWYQSSLLGCTRCSCGQHVMRSSAEHQKWLQGARRPLLHDQQEQHLKLPPCCPILLLLLLPVEPSAA